MSDSLGRKLDFRSNWTLLYCIYQSAKTTVLVNTQQKAHVKCCCKIYLPELSAVTLGQEPGQLTHQGQSR